MSVARSSRAVAFDLLAPSRTNYVCRSCRRTLFQSNTTKQQQRYASNENIPFTEKLRRKIWGTDNPPGLKDPYGGPSFLERAMERRRKDREAGGQPVAPGADSELQTRQAPPKTSVNDVRRSEVQEQGMVKEYVPAETWDGLEHVGHKGDRKDLDPVPAEMYFAWRNTLRVPEYISRGQETIPYGPSITFTALARDMHQAMVEALACQSANHQALDLRYTEKEWSAISEAEIALNFEGMLSQVKNDEPEHLLASVITEVIEAQSQRMADGEFESTGREDEFDVVSLYEPGNMSFLDAKLDILDPLTFKILKRFSQLSGQRIPDPMINSTIAIGKPVSELLNQLESEVKPKPKNLAEKLGEMSTLQNQSNVMVLSRRETPVDKEMELGRWKVIEKELRLRGLPVLGKVVVE